MRRSLLALLLAGPLAAQQPGVDVQAYHFRIDLPDTGAVIKGLATVMFEARPGYDDTLRLDLLDMTVDRVFDLHTLDRVPFSYDGRVIRIATRGDVVVQYHGRPRDGLIAGTTVRGRRAFFGDNWPNRARYWLPTVDHPSDKARVLWSVRAPRGMRVVTNAPQCRPGQTVRCNESAPMPTYTMVLGASVMTVSRHRPAVAGGDTVPIEVWSYPEDSAFADTGPFRRATEIVETMMRLVGPPRYAKLAHVESSTRYGGMENATAIFYDERSWARRQMREGVVRHETAHQWFGDAVTERDWHHLWLSEGFASYFDLVIGAALDGDSVLSRGMVQDAAQWLASDVIDRPVIDTTENDPNKLLNANVYPKGAWVLHMLRNLVGDSAFFRGIRSYYATWRDSSVLTDQFQQAMERESGRRLGWFFGQWLRQPGLPRLDVAWRLDSGRVRVEVLQNQPDAWGKFAIPELPVAFMKGARVIATRTFELLPSTSSQVMWFDVGESPEAIIIDPQHTILLQSSVRYAGP